MEDGKRKKKGVRSGLAQPTRQHMCPYPPGIQSPDPLSPVPPLPSLVFSAAAPLSRSPVPPPLHFYPSRSRFPLSSLLLPFPSQTSMHPLRSTSTDIPFQIKGLRQQNQANSSRIEWARSKIEWARSKIEGESWNWNQGGDCICLR